MKWFTDWWSSLWSRKKAKQPRSERYSIHWTAPSAATIGVILAFLLFAGIALWIILAVWRFFSKFWGDAGV